MYSYNPTLTLTIFLYVALYPFSIIGTFIDSRQFLKTNELHVRIQRGGAGGWSPPPLKNHKKYRVSLQYWSASPENHKANKPAFNDGPSSACQRNAGPFIAVFGSSILCIVSLAWPLELYYNLVRHLGQHYTQFVRPFILPYRGLLVKMLITGRAHYCQLIVVCYSHWVWGFCVGS